MCIETTGRVSVGSRFGRLCVEALTRKPVEHKRKRSRAYADVVCDCGTRKSVPSDDLVSGKIKSCGCLRRENGKANIRPMEDRFWEKVNKNGPVPSYRPDLGSCWIWGASVNANGYGTMGVDKGSTLAHRISYIIANGEILNDMQLDHLCRVHNCVNPRHLEPVTPRVNVHRGYGPTAANARKTHCPQGHPYSEENTYLYIGGVHKGNRQCRICGRKRTREYIERKRLAALNDHPSRQS